MECLPASRDPAVLVGCAAGDDSGVYQLTPELAIVQSVDVLTPIVDDPRTFGRIAAANALSDLYAMGARPRTALNVLALPPGFDEPEVAREMLLGGLEKVREAGAVVLGGHTIEDPELKYGLCVTGTVHPRKLLTNAGARPGDALVLTKPLGTGIVATAVKGGLASEAHARAAAAAMAGLNKAAAEAALERGAHGCTDVTGFGFVGHLLRMLAASGVGAVVEAGRVPLLPGAIEYCGMGLVPAGTARCKDYYACRTERGEGVSEVVCDVLFDAQTSGGLLIAVPDGDALVERLRRAGCEQATAVGQVAAEPAGRLRIV